MQGRENSSDSIVGRSLLQHLYPGKCGYKSETGGIMKNLRESTTNENVIKYLIYFILIINNNKYLYFVIDSQISPCVLST
jgi:Zn-dependent M16 (insulinase) family peptidase